MDIRHIYNNFESLINKEIQLVGFVKSNRFNGKIGFIEITDGTDIRTIQLIYKPEVSKDIEKISSVNTGDSISIKGIVIKTPEGKLQKFEVQLSELTLLKECDSDYPLQKKRHGVEFLREIAHIRPRSNMFQSVMRVRSEIAFAIHSFFKQNNFVWVSSPIITSNDGEGAGEAFNILADNKEFFNQKASLSVTGQLQAEAYAQAFKKVYTFGPTFRAEKSHTSKHAAEFWMLEPEIAFSDLDEMIKLISDMLIFIINYYQENCSHEIAYFEKIIDSSITERLNKIKEVGFTKMSYEEAIDILTKEVNKNKKQFEDNNIHFGMDLGTEHERFISEKVINGPVFIYNYPKEIKAFYMKENEDKRTVAATDLLVPGIGELIGGSQREDDYQKIINVCKERGMSTEELSWYIDLRRFGYYKSSGFGLGFERLLMYLTGVDNIRDVIPFPRTHGALKF